ncbi:MAG: polysaccharide biosynthesis protein, partial [Bacteroidota bacterium]
EIRKTFDRIKVRSILGDVTDQVKMDRIFNTCRPNIVFHAAAYKHVPLMEENPHEAIRVNVGSTMVLTRLAQKYKVSKFVMVSTDKAVNPTNIMGTSKRICEMILQARSITPGNRVQFVITRFGNVLGSNGSVIPIFRKQIEEGGPVTVTHPEITRYFMTIPEACQLVLEAGFMGLGGEIFVFEMGEPVKIADLARQMIRLSGYKPDEDIRIEYVGLRPGEKLYEELLTDKERTMPTYNPMVKVAGVAWLNHREVFSMVHELLATYPVLSDAALVEKIKTIVPEFNSSNGRYAGSNGKTESVEMEVYPD